MVDIVLSNLTHDYREIASSKVPLSVGVIGAFLSTKIPDANITVFNQIKYIENLISEFPKNKKIIFGFSNFLWNQALNIAISKIIKSNFINSIIVFGGPNLSSDSFEREIFLKTNKQIDFYILDEGEYAFYKLVDLCINKNLLLPTHPLVKMNCDGQLAYSVKKSISSVGLVSELARRRNT